MIKLMHHARVLVPALLLSLALGGMAAAQSEPTAPADSQVGQEIEELNLEQLLTQIQLASDQVNYQGVFVSHWANQHLVTSAITNLYQDNHLLRRIYSMDDSPIEVLRTDNQQIQLFPDRQIVISTPIRDHEFPGLLLTKASGIANYYFAHELKVPGRVAGIPCKKILLEPRDDKRYGFRLCVEPVKRLLLQIETVNLKQQIVSQTTFTQVLFDDQLDADAIQTEHEYVNWEHLKPRSDEVDLAAEGWDFTLPSGFQKVTSFKLLMGTKKEVRQLTLSDGLSSFSLFIQELDQQEREHYGQSDLVEGPVNIYSRRLGNYWLTALGAIPIATLQAVAESAQHRSLAE
ncbi:Sigma factor AlgU regulatory protein MucB [Oligella sp. MSHR50489EDL]|uniref:MucB/RseB C-terminal domain-containing protein n=1 Tax=Oligella sp. MSHR50489EDL TaxID=3139409 RepID=UPI003D819A16